MGKKKKVPVKASEKALVPRAKTVPAAKEEVLTPEGLIALAVRGKLPMETIERLVALRDKEKAEWAKEQYFAALALFQRECPTVLKKKKVLNRDNSLRYKYAPLGVIADAIKEALERHGLSYTFRSKQTDKSVTSVCVIHHVAGHEEESEMAVDVDFAMVEAKYMTRPQAFGSASTFGKRYALCNGLGIAVIDEDDDAGSLGEKRQEVTKAEEGEAGDGGASINALCDGVLDKIRKNFASNVDNARRTAMENRLMDLHKKGDLRGMVAFDKDVDRQITFKRRGGQK